MPLDNQRQKNDLACRGPAVLLAVPNETPYDLRWRMFGVHVRVHPLFWLLSILLGWQWFADPRGGIAYLALWVGCVFVSILLHEFGHVLMGRVFGSRGHIILYSFGGLAVGSSNLPRRWQRVAVLFAGPLAQLLLWGILKVSIPRLPLSVFTQEWGIFLLAAITMLLNINLYWPLLNLLPIWPLDGGQISREVCEGVLGRRGVSIALGVSLVVAGALAVLMLLKEKDPTLYEPYVPRGGIYLAVLFALLAAGSFQAMQFENERRSRWDDDDFP